MSNQFEDIPTLESAGRLGRVIAPDSPLAGAFTPSQSVPDELGRLDVGVALEVADRLQQRAFPGGALMGKLFPARAATSYTQHLDCGGYSYAGTCQQPCFGTSPQYMGSLYCATCTERAANPAQNPAYFWHFTGTRGGGTLTIKYWGQHSVCNGRGAWKWKINQACGSCRSSSVIRCHDGYKQIQGQAPIFTICEGRVICDGTLQTCP